MEAIRIGQATLRLNVEGCIRCGAHYSSAWFPARTVSVVVDGRKPIQLELYACVNCHTVPSNNVPTTRATATSILTAPLF